MQFLHKQLLQPQQLRILSLQLLLKFFECLDVLRLLSQNLRG